MQTAEDRPLIAIADERSREAEERTREIHARCVTVERACAAIGFVPGSCYDRVATLIARVAGHAVLRRTALEISRDGSVGFSSRHVHRAIAKLVEVGLLECEEEPSPRHHCVGRPPKFLRLQLRWDEIHRVVAAEDKWRRGELDQPHSHPQKTPAGQPAELRTFNRHLPGTHPASTRHTPGIYPADDRPLANRSYVNPYTLSPSPSLFHSPGDDDDEDAGNLEQALVDAGVQRVRQLLAESVAAKISTAELLDAAYVCQHWAPLTGGAMFDWVRSGGWPCSGVPPADVLRHDRRKAAEAIRSRIRTEASQRTPEPPEQVIQAVICRRLRAAQPAGCKTDLADELTAEELRGESMAAIAKTRQAVS